MAVCQNLVPLVNIKIAGKWMFIPLKMVLIGIDPYPYCWWWITSYYIWLVVDLPPEKYESQIGSSSQLLGKIENVPNHQPVILRTSIYLLHLTSISSFVLILMIIQKKKRRCYGPSPLKQISVYSTDLGPEQMVRTKWDHQTVDVEVSSSLPSAAFQAGTPLSYWLV